MNQKPKIVFCPTKANNCLLLKYKLIIFFLVTTFGTVTKFLIANALNINIIIVIKMKISIISNMKFFIVSSLLTFGGAITVSRADQVGQPIPNCHDPPSEEDYIHIIDIMNKNKLDCFSEEESTEVKSFLNRKNVNVHYEVPPYHDQSIVSKAVSKFKKN